VINQRTRIAIYPRGFGFIPSIMRFHQEPLGRNAKKEKKQSLHISSMFDLNPKLELQRVK
jgi:hypothetical protein